MKCFFITACLVLFVVPSLAADRFTQIDANNDKNLDWNEFSAAMPNLKKKAFDTIDTDSNGIITSEEWAQFSSKHGNQKSAMQGKTGTMNSMMKGTLSKESMQQKMNEMMQNAKKETCPMKTQQKNMPLITPPQN